MYEFRCDQTTADKIRKNANVTPAWVAPVDQAIGVMIKIQSGNLAGKLQLWDDKKLIAEIVIP